jgi:hypothetical protein
MENSDDSVPLHGQPGHHHRQWYSNVGKDRRGRVLRVTENTDENTEEI